MRVNQLVTLVIILAVVILLNLPVPASLQLKAGTQDALVPFQNLLTFLLIRGRNLVAVVSGESMGGPEVTDLLTENAQLRYELEQMEEIRRDNVALRKMFAFRNRQSRQLQLAEIISRGDVGGWWHTVTLNRGSRNGVLPQAAVITTEGLVGRVLTVSRRTSIVLMITDPACRVSCRIAGSDAFGVVSGTGVAFDGEAHLQMLTAPEPLRMSYVSRNYEVERGDTVVTSGLGGVFPEGLIVGDVLKSDVDASGLYQRFRVSPAAHLATLRYVFVVGE